jgi:molybdopterin biosynthesis enzyme MoaB
MQLLELTATKNGTDDMAAATSSTVSLLASVIEKGIPEFLQYIRMHSATTSCTFCASSGYAWRTVIKALEGSDAAEKSGVGSKVLLLLM